MRKQDPVPQETSSASFALKLILFVLGLGVPAWFFWGDSDFNFILIRSTVLVGSIIVAFLIFWVCNDLFHSNKGCPAWVHLVSGLAFFGLSLAGWQIFCYPYAADLRLNKVGHEVYAAVDEFKYDMGTADISSIFEENDAVNVLTRTMETKDGKRVGPWISESVRQKDGKFVVVKDDSAPNGFHVEFRYLRGYTGPEVSVVSGTSISRPCWGCKK